jgi:hypothetical protein
MDGKWSYVTSWLRIVYLHCFPPRSHISLEIEDQSCRIDRNTWIGWSTQKGWICHWWNLHRTTTATINLLKAIFHSNLDCPQFDKKSELVTFDPSRFTIAAKCWSSFCVQTRFEPVTTRRWDVVGVYQKNRINKTRLEERVEIHTHTHIVYTYWLQRYVRWDTIASLESDSICVSSWCDSTIVAGCIEGWTSTGSCTGGGGDLWASEVEIAFILSVLEAFAEHGGDFAWGWIIPFAMIDEISCT